MTDDEMHARVADELYGVQPTETDYVLEPSSDVAYSWILSDDDLDRLAVECILRSEPFPVPLNDVRRLIAEVHQSRKDVADARRIIDELVYVAEYGHRHVWRTKRAMRRAKEWRA